MRSPRWSPWARRSCAAKPRRPEPAGSDRDGNVEELTPAIPAWSHLAPTGDGRIYLADTMDLGKPFRWIDAANRPHISMDESGLLPYTVPGLFAHPASAMIYHAETNAPFLAQSSDYDSNCLGFQDPELSGAQFVIQAVFFDAGAIKGSSMTQGLTIEVG